MGMLCEESEYYLAGPMSGRPQFNFPMFEAVSSMLRMQGYNIVSPHELDDVNVQAAALASFDGAFAEGEFVGQTWGDFLSRDVKIVADEVDAVIALPGWQHSRGALLEVFVAILSGKAVYQYCPHTGKALEVSISLLKNIIDDAVNKF